MARENVEIKREYDEHFKKNPNKWTNQDRNDFALKTIKEFAPGAKNFLDIGCGNGHTLVRIAKDYPEADLTGLDISSEAIKLCQKQLPDATFIQSSFEDLNTRKKFDVVLNMGTIEHIEDINGAMKKLKSLIRSKDGICYFEAPNNLSYSPGSKTYRRLSTGSKQMEWHSTREMWEELFETHGLKVVGEFTGNHPVFEFLWVLTV